MARRNGVSSSTEKFEEKFGQRRTRIIPYQDGRLLLRAGEKREKREDVTGRATLVKFLQGSQQLNQQIFGRERKPKCMLGPLSSGKTWRRSSS